MKKYNVCVVGIGAVGTEMVRLLEKRNFPIKALTILARSERMETIDKKEYAVKIASEEAFDGMDFAFFAGTEGSKGASKLFGEAATSRGCTVIDNGDDFRMDPWVPLVIPEINPEALEHSKGFIANPNCSTIIALMALAPLYKKNRIKRIVASTYQAVSGTGAGAVQELKQQIADWGREYPLARKVYPHQILLNVIPAVGSFKDQSGESTEEIKMRREIQKILGDVSIKVSKTSGLVAIKFDGESASIICSVVNRIFCCDFASVSTASASAIKYFEFNRYVAAITLLHEECHALPAKRRSLTSIASGFVAMCANSVKYSF